MERSNHAYESAAQAYWDRKADEAQGDADEAAIEAQAIRIAETPAEFFDCVIQPLLDGDSLCEELALLSHPDYRGDLAGIAGRLRRLLAAQLNAAATQRCN
jgi:hypothetical protein